MGVEITIRVVDGSVLVAATTDAGAEGTWADHVLAEGGVVAPHLVLKAFGVPLATLDRRLSRASGPSCRFRLPR